MFPMIVFFVLKITHFGAKTMPNDATFKITPRPHHFFRICQTTIPIPPKALLLPYLFFLFLANSFRPGNNGLKPLRHPSKCPLLSSFKHPKGKGLFISAHPFTTKKSTTHFLRFSLQRWPHVAFSIFKIGPTKICSL
jgi:hypothetical protein